MSQIVDMLKKRQGNTPTEDFAHEIGIRSASLYAYYRGERNMGIGPIRKIAKRYKNDDEMIKALARYALGI